MGRGGRQRRTVAGQLLQQHAPLRLEDVGPGETAVPADHTQAGDAQLNQVTCGLQAAFPSTEVLAAGTANDGPSLEEKTLFICLLPTAQTPEHVRAGYKHRTWCRFPTFHLFS